MGHVLLLRRGVNFVGDEMTPEEKLHLAASSYATNRRVFYDEAAKEGIAIKRTLVQMQGIWLAHYEGYREGYWVATGNEFATDPAKLNLQKLIEVTEKSK